MSTTTNSSAKPSTPSTPTKKHHHLTSIPSPQNATVVHTRATHPFKMTQENVYYTRMHEAQGLSLDILFHIFSFATISEVSCTLIHLNYHIRMQFVKRFLDASFLRARERRCFEDVIYGKAREKDRCLSDKHCGFPQLYHDLYTIRHFLTKKNTKLASPLLYEVWHDGLKRMGTALTSDLEFSFDTFASFMELYDKYEMHNEHRGILRRIVKIGIFSEDAMVMRSHLANGHLKNPKEFLMCAPRLQESRAFIMDLVQCCPMIYPLLKMEFKEDREIIRRTVRGGAKHARFDAKCIKHFPPQVLADEDFVIQLMKLDVRVLNHTWSYFKSPDFLRRALAITPHAFPCASETLRADMAFVEEAIRQKNYVLPHVPEGTLTDKLILKAAKKGAFQRFQKIPQFENNRDAVMAAVKSGGLLWRWIPKQYRKDKKIVLELAKKDPCQYMLLSDRWKSDNDIVAAVLGNEHAVRHLPEDLRATRSLMEIAVSKNGNNLQFVDATLKDDEKIVLPAIRHTPCALRFASERLRGTKSVVMEAVQRDGCALRFATSELGCDEELILAGLKTTSGFSLRSMVSHIMPDNGKTKSEEEDS